MCDTVIQLESFAGSDKEKNPAFKEYSGMACSISVQGARCSSVVRAFTHGAMGRRIDPSWGGPIELFLIPASVPRLV